MSMRPTIRLGIASTPMNSGRIASENTVCPISKTTGYPISKNTGRPISEHTGCPIQAALLPPGWDRKHSAWIALTFGLVLCLFAPIPSPAQQQPVVLDSAVAVVNRHVILASDIDDEIRLSVLDPDRVGQGVLTRQLALEQLISRALIEQQIRREDAQAAEPAPEEVNARLAELRKELPACVRENCASDAGWKTFLAAHDLTPERVDAYARYRLEILRFIEQRFRQGIHIMPQQIETYYHDTLLPQYSPGEAVPSLETVSPRIEEILLQQQVNQLFDAWLTNLRKQGDVEVLDPSLETPDTLSGVQQSSPAAEGKGSQ